MNILAISLAYPPLAYPRSIQVARLLKHTDAKTALFCADEADARLDLTIEPDAEKLLQSCLRIPVVTRSGDKLLNRFSYRFYGSLWKRRNLTPDAYRRWGKDVLGSTQTYLRTSGFAPDVIVTFAQPFTDHLIGLELKKGLGLPWLAHFSDPWTDNPFSNFDAKTLTANLALERSVAERADILAFTSTETVDLFYEKYSTDLRKRAVVLPQCFDAGQFPQSRPQGRITVRYLGNFYGRRTPRPLIEALRHLVRRNRELIDDISFELIGSGDADEVRKLSSDLPGDLVVVRPNVSYAESLKLMSLSDGLLVIDAPAEKSVFLPSKLIDYIGADRPVFGITPSGTAAKLITELGGDFSDPSDIEQLAGKLATFVDQLRKRRIEKQTSWGEENVRNRFTANNVAREFGTILEKLVS